jgi:hypothetical protein
VRSRDVRCGAIRDHGVATVIAYYCGDGRDYESKGDKYPTNGVNLRRVFRIACLVQVRPASDAAVATLSLSDDRARVILLT